jgi:hypothetical protein
LKNNHGCIGELWESFCPNMSLLLKPAISTDSMRINTQLEEISRRSWNLVIKRKLNQCWRSTNCLLKDLLNHTLPCTSQDLTLTFGESTYYMAMLLFQLITLVITSQSFCMENQLRFISMSNILIWSLPGFMITLTWMMISTMQTWREIILIQKLNQRPNQRILSNS